MKGLYELNNIKENKINDFRASSYDMEDVIKNLYTKSKDHNAHFNYLWKKIVTKKNILYAVNMISDNPERNTPGPDNMVYKDIKKMDDEEIYKKVKRRLYGDIQPKYKTIYRENIYGKKEIVYISNLLDRISERAIYNILEPILEARYYPFNFSYRRNVGKKECFGTIWNKSWNSTDGCMYKTTIDNIYQDSNLNDILNLLRLNFGIKDIKLIKCIERLMTNNDVNGISKYSILGPALINVLLHDLEIKFNDLNEINRHMIKGDRLIRGYFRESRVRRNDSKKYFKYAKSRRAIDIIKYDNEIMLISNNPYDIYDGIFLIYDWLKSHHLKYNKEDERIIHTNKEFSFTFVGYKMNRLLKDDGFNFTFGPLDSTLLWKSLKKELKYKVNHHYDLIELQKSILKYFYYLDFTTSTRWLNTLIDKWLFNNHRRLGWTKVKGSSKYIDKKGNSISGWECRQWTNISISQYAVKCKYWDPTNTNSNRTLNGNINHIMQNYESFGGFRHFLPILMRRDMKEPVRSLSYTEIPLFRLHVHHIKPQILGGTNDIDNLIAIDNESHKLIHYKNYIPKSVDVKYFNKNRLTKYREKLKSK